MIRQRVELLARDQKTWESPIVRVPYFEIQFENQKKQQELLAALPRIFDQVLWEIRCDQKIENLEEQKWQERCVYLKKYHFGVTDSAAATLQETLELFNLQAKVSSGEMLLVKKSHADDNFRRQLLLDWANPLIENVSEIKDQAFYKGELFNLEAMVAKGTSHSYAGDKQLAREISLDGEVQELKTQFDELCLAFSLEEIEQIKKYYQKLAKSNQRQDKGLPKWPTDVELEMLAQTWSEHCKHKIFAAKINYEGEEGTESIDGLFKTYIKNTTEEVIKKFNLDWCISLFSDNAGIVRFDDKVDLCLKVETHNSPSALDPYGGSLTGILGVNRDILGTGLGAKPIANMDIFCLPPPDWKYDDLKATYPATNRLPKALLKGVHLGVEHGGNKSGIPTINGSFFFHPSFSAKPLVFVGTLGVMPQTVQGQASAFKKINPGDLVVMSGGKVGLDGIHGATFSSLEINEHSPSSAVQIGDPYTQKILSDFLLAARDLFLYNFVTDNGAGGISSSVGEMARESGGATLFLDKVPLKYPGLAPWQVLVSESQERMSFAVSPEKIGEFLQLSQEYGVESTVIGEFTDTQEIALWWDKKVVGILPLEFLHDGVPKLQLKARFSSSCESKKEKQHGDLVQAVNLFVIAKKLLANANITSKEKLVRRFDHEVQAATMGKPYCGKNGHAPADGGVLLAARHGGDVGSTYILAHGLAPKLGDLSLDGKVMGQWAFDEAFRSQIALGADPTKIALLDNFCWPDPVASAKVKDGERKLGQLVRTCQATREMALEFGTPFISGKDSMKNDYRGKSLSGQQVTSSILPTLLITSLGSGKTQHVPAPYFKRPDELVLLIGARQLYLGASSFEEMIGEKLGNYPQWQAPSDLSKLYHQMHELIKQDAFTSLHDVSDGGSFIALLECAIGGELGVNLKFSMPQGAYLDQLLFGEGCGHFIASISSDKLELVRSVLGERMLVLGATCKNSEVKLEIEDKFLAQASLLELKKSYLTGIDYES